MDRQSSNTFERIIADASQAPSAGNVQPWSWQRVDGGLRLNHRRGQGKSVLYHDDRAAMVGLGASFESALISAAELCLDVEADISISNDEIASLRLNEQSSMVERTASLSPLYPQLARRRSVRIKPETVSQLSDTNLSTIANQISGFDGFNFACLKSPREVAELAELIGEAESLRILDPDSHADMVNEIAWSEQEHFRTGEGIPISSLSLTPTEQAGLDVIKDPDVIAALANWKLGKGLGKLAHDLIISSSAVALIWTEGDTYEHYFHGGRALQRAWLEATRLDIGVCPVTAICYLLRAWRVGWPFTEYQRQRLSNLEGGFRRLFSLPKTRSDIALFRLVPASDELNRPRATLRRHGQNPS